MAATELRYLVRTREAELALLGSAQRQQPACALALVSFNAHFRVLLQFFLSIGANVVDPGACSLLVLVSTPSETAELRRLLGAPAHASQLAAVLPQLTVVDFPAVFARLSPKASSSLPSAKNVGPLGRLYVCAKKAYAARYAHEVLGAAHAIVTDSEAYVWKEFSMARLFADAAVRPTVWYSDAPFHAKVRRERESAPAPVDATWCSQHVYGDMRGATRGAVRTRSPSPTAKYFESMLFYYPRDAFREYWAAVERAWGGKPWYDAIVAAHEAEPRCVPVGFWMEVSWHLFMYEFHRPRVEFRNVTAAIEAAFGTAFVRANSYVHARLELLWRAVNNDTIPAFRRFYEAAPLQLFRFEFRLRGNCLPLRLLAELPPPVASLQANSAVPNWIFSGACDRELARMPTLARRSANGSSGSGLPWVAHSTKT